MPGVPADAVIKIGRLVGGAKTGHVYCHRATEFSHAACQSAPIQNRPRIAVHENHCFIGICRSEFEQRRTYAVNDDRGPLHSSAIDLLSLSSGHARLGYALSVFLSAPLFFSIGIGSATSLHCAAITVREPPIATRPARRVLR